MNSYQPFQLYQLFNPFNLSTYQLINFSTPYILSVAGFRLVFPIGVTL
jgi:hypothetical protein